MSSQMMLLISVSALDLDTKSEVNYIGRLTREVAGQGQR